MKKAVYHVMLITIVAKLLGFGREILLSYYFGASGISDAYLISQTIPGTIFQFVGTGLATSFIPVYLKIKMSKGDQRADAFTNTVLSAILVFSTAVILGVCFFTDPLIKIFASGFQGQTLDYAVLFTRIGIFSLYFSAAIYVFTSYLQANESFAMVSFIAIPNSIVVMAAIALGAKWNLLALPIGSLFAVLIQVILLWFSMKKKKYRLKLNWDFRDSYVKEILLLMVPVVVGVSVNQINVLVDRTIASQIAVGGISALMYADSLIMFVQGIFSQSVATVYYPSITKLAEEKEEEKLKEILQEALDSIVFILLPIMAGCIILSKGIVHMLYGRGAFDEQAVALTGTALACYGVGILGYGIREMLSRIFYAYHDTKTPMRNAMIGMGLNIFMNITFSFYMGIGGLALATSLSSVITAVLLYLAVKKRFGNILTGKNKREYGKMSGATLGMGIFVWLFFQAAEKHFGCLAGTVAAVLLGAAIYLVLCKILRVETYQKWKDILQKTVLRKGR